MLKVAFQMNHINSVDISGDSTFRIALEAQKRGHKLYHYTPDNLRMEQEKIVAEAGELELREVKSNHYSLTANKLLNLDSVDVVWLRQDPPFDMAYILTTYLLERLQPSTLVVNDPFWVRNLPEKLMVLDYPDLIPKTLITREFSAVETFRSAHQDVIIKPLFGNGGTGIFRIQSGDNNLKSLCEMFFQISREPIIVQEFLPEIKDGDKRVILVGGEPVGAINRIPAEGENRSNLHVGGKALKADLTDRDIEISLRIGKDLLDKGLIFAGIDIIGDKLTEINLTSPTGLIELEKFDGTNAASLIWDVIERKLK